MKIQFLKVKNWLLLTAMGFFGLTACHTAKEPAQPTSPETPEPTPGKVTDRGGGAVMYGVPTMNFRISGQVKDTDGRPVKDIRVNMLERNMEATAAGVAGEPDAVERWLENTAAVTDSEGRFELKDSGLPQETVRLLVRDVDGKENGDLKDQLVNIKVQQGDIDREGAGGWNQGTFKKEVSVTLENK